jgi:hypothetical protein
VPACGREPEAVPGESGTDAGAGPSVKGGIGRPHILRLAALAACLALRQPFRKRTQTVTKNLQPLPRFASRWR